MKNGKYSMLDDDRETKCFMVLINTRLQPGAGAQEAMTSGFNRFPRARENR